MGFINWQGNIMGYGDLLALFLMIVGGFWFLFQAIKITWHIFDYMRTRKEFMQTAIKERKRQDDED